GRAAFRWAHRGADVPLDLLVGVGARRDEAAPQADAPPRGGDGRIARLLRNFALDPRVAVLPTLFPRPLHGHRHQPPQLPDVAFQRSRRRGIAQYLVLSTFS